MLPLLIAIVTQTLTFLPLAVALYVSFCIMRATDMTLDGSFVLGAAIFAKLLEAGVSPAFAGCGAIIGGMLAGAGVSLMQRGEKISSLLAGVLATFILSSGNLLVMGRPNISLLGKTTLLSPAFAIDQLHGWILVACYSLFFCCFTCLLLFTRCGLNLRAFGDNPNLLQRLGRRIEVYRLCGFAFTNCLAAISGCLTAQTIGYVDIGMGLGVTLTALGAVILGRQLIGFFNKTKSFNVVVEFMACLVGVIFYFLAINSLLRLSIDPIYLKMLLGIVLVFCLRAAAMVKYSRGDAI
jgi:putative tryptophan/tyrosine transport system permease protein